MTYNVFSATLNPSQSVLPCFCIPAHSHCLKSVYLKVGPGVGSGEYCALSHLLVLALYIHRVSKNVAPLACCNSDTRGQTLILFGRNVTDNVGTQKML